MKNLLTIKYNSVVYGKLKNSISKTISLLILTVSILTGCTSIGPKTILVDRLDYTEALSESWKKQTLLNLVKLRYGDAPLFLDVVSVISSHELSGTADLGANWKFGSNGEPEAKVGLKGFYSDRPTITYRPVIGEAA